MRVKKDANARRNLDGCITATINYFQNTEEGKICCPSNVPKVQWRKAKTVEILYEIEKSFPRRTNIFTVCETEIARLCENDDPLLVNFTYAELLLMSQCVVWSDNQIRLSFDVQNSVVREAIDLLKEMENDANAIVSERAKSLLNRIREERAFVKFFPPEN
ncbi:MAG: hypothetical protein LBF34_04180 [Puniceicoccales bacterium]|jgi:hypothetical protein|nr:hypothetical protein [Puniceicoccales bacterium]